MAKPKLALIPAAQGTKFYSVLPSDGSGDFTFARGSVATRINAQGLIENVASGVSRLNYPMIDGVVKGCPHHILEPARTNYIPYSEDFSNAAWTKFGGGTGAVPIVTLNQGISPDGTNNATRIEFSIAAGTTTSDQSIVLDSVTVPSADTTQKSIYLKSNTSNSYELIIYESTNASGTNVKKITVTTEWKRFVVYGAVSSTTSGLAFGLRNINVSGVSQSADVLVYGAQLESGSFPTSYIPTSGESGGVTRSAETATGAGDASTFNDSEGVLMAEISAENETSSFARRISILNTTSNRILIGAESASSTIRTVITVGGSSKFDVSSSQLVTTNNKIAVKYSSNGSEMYINGFTVGISAIDSSFPSSTLNDLQFGSGNGNSPFYGNTKQLQYFDSALADTQLEQLTSWQSFRDMANGQLYTIE